jgi:hypothetical protein
MSTEKTKVDPKVGKGRPPEHTRWKPGESGNPKGRPKAAKSEPTDVAEVLGEPLSVKQAGTTRKMSPFEVGVRQLVKRALSKSDLRAILEFVRLCESYELIAPQPPPEQSGGVLVVPWDWDEWRPMFEKLGPPPWSGERPGLPDESGVGPTQEEDGNGKSQE